MNFAFMKDPQWSAIDDPTRQSVIGAAFSRDIESDPEWDSVPDDLRQKARSVYFSQAKQFEASLNAVPERGTISDLISHGARGVVSAAEAIGGGMRMLDMDPEKDEGIIGRAGKAITDWSEDARLKHDILKPDKAEVEGKDSLLWRGVTGAVESTPASLVPLAGGVVTGALAGSVFGPPGAIIGGAIGGATTLFGTFGLGQYQNSYDEAKKKLQGNGVTDQTAIQRDAHDFALKSAVAEAGGEFVGDLAAMTFFGVFGKKAVSQGVSQTIRQLISPGGVKEFIGATAKTVPFEAGSEMGTAYVQAKAARDIGISEVTPETAVKEAILPAVFMSLMFGGAIRGTQAMEARRLYQDLNGTDADARVEAAKKIAGRLDPRDTISQRLWTNTALSYITSGKEIPLSKPIVDLASQGPKDEAPAPRADNENITNHIMGASSANEAIAAFSEAVGTSAEVNRVIPPVTPTRTTAIPTRTEEVPNAGAIRGNQGLELPEAGGTLETGQQGPGNAGVYPEAAVRPGPGAGGENLQQDQETGRGSGGQEQLKATVDSIANGASTSPLNDIPQPTDDQKKAGNYQKAHLKGDLVNLAGLDITIENPEGSTRTQEKPDNAPANWKPEWSSEMKNAHYGYFKRTLGRDGDQIDVFIGPNPEAQTAFIVDQIDPKTGKFDEHKTLVGYSSEGEAKAAYLSNYEPGWKGLGAIAEVPIDQFKAWVADGTRKTEPVAYKEKTGTKWKAPTPARSEEQPPAASPESIGNGRRIAFAREYMEKESARAIGKGQAPDTAALMEEGGRKWDADEIPRAAIKRGSNVFIGQEGQTHEDILNNYNIPDGERGSYDADSGELIPQEKSAPRPGDKSFIDNKIRELGTVEAVNAFYSGKDPVSDYARTMAPKILGVEREVSREEQIERGWKNQATAPPAPALPSPTGEQPPGTGKESAKGEIVQPGAKTGKEPWEMTREEFEANPPVGYQIKKLAEEDIARAEADGTISLDPENFFGHAARERADIIAHEKAHFLEEKISPQDKAELFDNPVVMSYRGRNINEKLANMISDGNLPSSVLADYPELAKKETEAVPARIPRSKNPMAAIAHEIKKNGRLQLGAKQTATRAKHGFLADYSKEDAKALNKMYPTLLSSTGTQNLDEIASDMGYNSGDDLFQALKYPDRPVTRKGEGITETEADRLTRENAEREEEAFLENARTEQALAELDADAIDAGRIEESRQEVGSDILGSDEAQGLSYSEEEALTELAAFFDDVSVTPTPTAEFPEQAELSPQQTYDSALEKMRQQARQFHEIRDQYRKGSIGDDEFLSAKKDYDAVQAEVDEAEKEFKRAPKAKKQATPKGEFETAALPGLSEAETFTLSNPETEMGVLQSKDRGPKTAGMFEEGEGKATPEAAPANLQDFGEKIGGARKDTAERGFTMTKKAAKEEEGPAILLPMIDGFVARPYPEGKERTAINEAFQKFVDTVKTRETPKGTEMYSVEERTAIGRDSVAFADQLDDFAAGKLLNRREPITIGSTPRVLEALGAEQIPLVITQGTVEKATTGKHGLTVDTLKQLPTHIADPIMIFDSATEADSLVVMTELKQDGKSVVAAIQLSREMGKNVVNDIVSVHPRNSEYHFINWINQGLLRYMNKSKSRAWSVASGLQLPGVSRTKLGSGKKILFDYDLVKKDYSVTAKDAGWSLSDVQRIFKGQEVIQPSPQGPIYIKTRGGQYLTIESVDHISPDEVDFKASYARNFDPKTETITGAYGEGVVRLVRGKAGAWTLAHESAGHFLEDSGILNTSDVAILKGYIKGQVRAGKMDTANKEDIGGAEDRANFLADALTEPPKGLVGRVVARVRKWIDLIMETFGKRTAGAITRDIESGRIFGRGLTSPTERSTGYSVTSEKGTGKNIPAKENPTPEAGMTREEFISHAEGLRDAKDFTKAWLTDNEDIPHDLEPNETRIVKKSNNATLIIKANQKGKAVGVVSVVTDGKGNAYLEHIAVNPQARRQGIATSLINEAKKQFNDVGFIGPYSHDVAGILYDNLVKKIPPETTPKPVGGYKTGEPATITGYHGTKGTIEKFSKENRGYNTFAVSAQKATFFTSERNLAKFYAETAPPKSVIDADSRIVPQIAQLEKELNKLDELPETEKVSKRIDDILTEIRGLKEERDIIINKVMDDYSISSGKDRKTLLLGDVRGDENIIQAQIRLENPKVIKQHGTRNISFSREIDIAGKEGHDGVIVENVNDPYPSDIFIVFDTEKINITPNPSRPLEGGGQQYSVRPRNPINEKLVTGLNARLAEQLSEEWRNAYKPATNIPQSVRGIIRAFEATFKTRVVAVTPTKEAFASIGGQTFKGTLFVDPHATTGFLQLAGHELLHKIKQEDKALYETFLSHARNVFRNIEGYEKAVAGTMQPGENPLTHEEIETELIADFTGDALADPEFLKYFAREDTGVFRKFMRAAINWLKDVSAKLSKSGFESSQYFADVNKLRNYLDGVLYNFTTRENVDDIDNGSPPVFSRKSSTGDLKNTEKRIENQTPRSSYANKESKAPPDSSDPKILNVYLKDETDALTKTIISKLHPPSMSFLERLLKSPEWFDHPQINRIVRLFTRDRNELYHTTFNYLNAVEDPSSAADTVSEAGKRLKNKGLSRTEIVMGKTSAEYKALKGYIDRGDTEKIKPEGMLALMEKEGATEDTISTWKLYRESYDKALDLMTAQMRAMIDQIKEEAAFKGQTPDFTEMEQTLKGALATMEEWNGSYAPRIREAGGWQIQAYKENGPLKESREWFREHKGTELQANRRAKELEREGWTIFHVGEVKRIPEDIYQDVKVMKTALLIDKALEKVGGKAGAKEDMIAKVNSEILQSIADEFHARGFRSSMIHRKGGGVVKGYIEDPIERHLLYINNLSRGMAKAKVARLALQELLGDYAPAGTEAQYGGRIGGIDPVNDYRAYAVAEEYIREQLRNIDQTDRIIGIAKSIATFKFLGFNLRSAAVNVTSTVTTAPAAIHEYVGEGKVSMTKVLGQLAGAGRDYAKVMAGKSLSNPDEQSFIDEIQRKGLDDAQYHREALGGLQKVHSKAWGTVMDASMYVFGKSEQWNRGTTMLAAYRIARKQGENHIRAMELAKDASDKAHGVYGKSTLPMWAMGENPAAKIGQLVYVYSKFSHNYLQMLYDMGFKRRNIKAAMFAFLSPLVLAGGAALPFKDAIFSFAGFILSALGISEKDPEKWVWDQIRTHIGKGAEAFGRHGLTGAAGIDISSSLSIGVGVPKNLWDIAGVAGAVVKGAGEAVGDIAGRQYGRAAEGLLPAGFASPVRAYREISEGVTTKKHRRVFDESGRPLYPSAGGTAVRALGFRPTSQAVLSERTWEGRREQAHFSDMRNEIYERYRAWILGKRDPEEYRGIMKSVHDFNVEVRGLRIRGEVPLITSQSLRSQVRRLRAPSKHERSILREQ